MTPPNQLTLPVTHIAAASGHPRREPAHASREPLFWLAQLAFWSSVGLLQWFLLIPNLRPLSQPADRLFVVVTRVVTGMLISTVLRFAYTRLARQPWSLRRILASGVAALFLAALVECLLFQGILTAWEPDPGWPRGRDNIPFALIVFHRIDVLTVWSLLFLGFFQLERLKSAELRAAEAEAALRTSELQRLESQLQPHFLFNALTAILSCRHDPKAVALVTNGLSEHLRYCLARQGLIEPLGREIDALEHFLCVQQARFGPNLEYTIHCTDEARQVPVPPMIVSPLLENSLKHGLLSSPTPLRIEVDCHVHRGILSVTVTNTGDWIEPGSQGRRGTGLANLRERLELHRCAGAELTCAPLGDRVQARITVPLQPTMQTPVPEDPV